MFYTREKQIYTIREHFRKASSNVCPLSWNADMLGMTRPYVEGFVPMPYRF